LRYGVKSDKGNVRENNEDNYNVIAGYPGVPVSYVIADGMGGHNSGEIASKMAVEITCSYILQIPELLSQYEDITSIIKMIMEKTNAEVFLASNEQESTQGMGTTLIIAVANNKKLHIGHIGDSRVYLIREGAITQITTDHSYIEELVRNGTLSREEAENHPKKNLITRALGCIESVEVDTYESDIQDNDVFIMCTDGLTNMLGDDEIKNIIIKLNEPESACNELVKMANENGGEDNITVIIFKSN
jgi:PPM family protein phosphatase